MAIPEPVRKAALKQVEAFCETRIPPHARDQVRLEASVRGDVITIAERRPPWRPDFGPDWTSQRIAQLRYDPDSGTWSLFARDRNDRLLAYFKPIRFRNVARLLAEIDADPTGIFWG